MKEFLDEEGWVTDELGSFRLLAEARLLAKKRGPSVFVHFAPRKRDILRIPEINGEVCASYVSTWGEFFSGRDRIGVLLKGQATAEFDYDCWSVRLPSGSRIPTRSCQACYSNHPEAWVVPKQAELVAIVCPDSRWAEGKWLSKRLGIGLMSVESLQDLKEGTDGEG